MAQWQLQEAKTRFSEVIEEAHTKGPQIITRHGAERAVLLSIGDYRSLVSDKPNLIEYLLGGHKVAAFDIGPNHDDNNNQTGGTQMPIENQTRGQLTALERAQMLQADEDYRRDQLAMSSATGIETIIKEARELFHGIEQRAKSINDQGLLKIRYGTDFGELNATKNTVVTDGYVGLDISWNQRFANSLKDSYLAVREFNGNLFVPGESRGDIHFQWPSQIRETKYFPHLSRTRVYGWKQENGEQFLSSSDLAEKVVIQFLDLVDAHRKANWERV
jgi:prevent-host-death family protein